MSKPTASEDPKEEERAFGKVFGVGNVTVWGAKRFYSSRAVVIPAVLAKRLEIKTGDTVKFKEDTTNGRIIIEKVEEEPK